MPDFPIVDAHLHLWDPRHFRMAWLDGNPVLDRAYGLKEYREHTAGVDIDAMVYLQVEVAPAYGLLEPRWVAERAAEDQRIKALVAWAPCEFGEQVRAYLDALVNTTTLLRGVRRLVQGESVDFCVQPRFVRGVQILAEYDLSFDLCIHHPQMASAIELVRRCPDVRFILDHIGKPNIKDNVMEPWAGQLREMASLPNIHCKVSGMVTEANHDAWSADDLRPYVDHVLDSFGEDRVVFGGDWPVAFQASTYPRWVETLDTLTAYLSPTAKRKLWSENARRFYRFE